jgi:hypothetical protein
MSLIQGGTSGRSPRRSPGSRGSTSAHDQEQNGYCNSERHGPEDQRPRDIGGHQTLSTDPHNDTHEADDGQPVFDRYPKVRLSEATAEACMFRLVLLAPPVEASSSLRQAPRSFSATPWHPCRKKSSTQEISREPAHLTNAPLTQAW